MSVASLKGLDQNNGATSSEMTRKHSADSSMSLRERMKQFTDHRQASDSNLLYKYHQEFTRPSHCSRQDLSPSEELPEQIFINDVPTPSLPHFSSSFKSGPTPPDKRVLDQKEFDKKLKAKRAIFTKGRSMSLASFRLPSRLRKMSASSPKKPKYWDKESETAEQAGPPRGELDFLNMDQLINVRDLESELKEMT